MRSMVEGAAAARCLRAPSRTGAICALLRKILIPIAFFATIRLTLKPGLTKLGLNVASLGLAASLSRTRTLANLTTR